MTKQEYLEIPTFLRKESKEYWAPGEEDEDFKEREKEENKVAEVDEE